MNPADLKPNHEQFERFYSSVVKREVVEYQYRDVDGELFACVAESLSAAQMRRAHWQAEHRVCSFTRDDVAPPSALHWCTPAEAARRMIEDLCLSEPLWAAQPSDDPEPCGFLAHEALGYANVSHRWGPLLRLAPTARGRRFLADCAQYFALEYGEAACPLPYNRVIL